MSEQHLYDEYKVPPQFWGWVMLDPLRNGDRGLRHVADDEHSGRAPVLGPRRNGGIRLRNRSTPPISRRRSGRRRLIVPPLPEGKPLEPENKPPKPGQY